MKASLCGRVGFTSQSAVDGKRHVDPLAGQMVRFLNLKQSKKTQPRRKHEHHD